MPIIHLERCTLCGDCVPACPQAALRLVDGRLEMDAARCAYCGDCEDVCPTGAIDLPFEIVLKPGIRLIDRDREGDSHAT